MWAAMDWIDQSRYPWTLSEYQRRCLSLLENWNRRPADKSRGKETRKWMDRIYSRRNVNYSITIGLASMQKHELSYWWELSGIQPLVALPGYPSLHWVQFRFAYLNLKELWEGINSHYLSSLFRLRITLSARGICWYELLFWWEIYA